MALLVSACVVGPDYQRPDLPAKGGWGGRAISPGEVVEIVRADWWKGFRDPYLDGLVGQAVESNLDLRILQGRIGEAGVGVTAAGASAMPTVGLSAGGQLARAGDTRTSTAATSEQYSAQVEIGWELDLWGKKKRKKLAAQAEHGAREAEYRAGYLKLVSEIAGTYFRIRQADELTDLTQGYLKSSRGILAIYQNQFSEGLQPKWKVSRQEAEVREIEKQLLELERVRALLVNRTATLLARPAGEFTVPRGTLTALLRPPNVPVGLPSDLLARRPDIIAAELRVKEAYHLVGEAQAARLPSFSLTASGGLVSSALSTLLSQWTVGLVPSLLQTIFDGGRRKSEVRINEARAKIAEDEYRKTVMQAFEEVENALVNLSNRSRQQEVVREKVGSLDQVRNATKAQLELGLISQLEIIDIERELLAAHQSRLEMQRLLLDDTVTLYKALGGGWPTTAEPSSAPKAPRSTGGS